MKKISKKEITVTEIYHAEIHHKQKLPLYLSKIYAGFPSPADDYLDKRLDLNEFLIKHPAATFFVRVDGDSMVNAGIYSGDILIVDRSLEPKNNKIIIAVVNGEFTVKRFRRTKEKIYLLSENPDFQPIEITEDVDFEIWGVVIHVIHSL